MARDGSEALEKIAALNPDVVTLDVEMPGLNGVETLRCIMAQSRRPVIMVSATTEKDAEITFSALGAGAFDYVPKQLSSTSLDIVHIRQDLIAKIKAAALIRGLALGMRKPSQAVDPGQLEPEMFSIVPAVVAIGISTGGPKALDMLPLFPRDLPVPILIVQHMPPGFTAPLCPETERIVLGRSSRSPPPRTCPPRRRLHCLGRNSHDCGTAFRFAPLDRSYPGARTSPARAFHRCHDGIRRFRFRQPNHGNYHDRDGLDGAQGIKSIHRRGGITLGQDEASCVVYGMPRACAEMGVWQRVVSLAQIPQQILRATRYRKQA